MKVNFVLLALAANEVKQDRVVYEYANQLANSNHDVAIYHKIKTPLVEAKSRKGAIIKLQFLQHVLRKKIRRKPSWITLHSSISSFEVVDLSRDLIRDALFIITTDAKLALEVFELPIAKGIKFDFIQSGELPTLQTLKNSTVQSYRLPINRIVTSISVRELVSRYAPTEPMLLTETAQGKPGNYQPQMQDLLHAGLTYLQRLQFT